MWLRRGNEAPILDCVFPPIRKIRRGQPEAVVRMIGRRNVLYLADPNQNGSE